MIAWAESPSASPLLLAIAEERRRHVQEQVSRAGVSIGCSTIKKGSPYKLSLTKPNNLLVEENRLRERYRLFLEQLTATKQSTEVGDI